MESIRYRVRAMVDEPKSSSEDQDLVNGVLMQVVEKYRDDPAMLADLKEIVGKHVNRVDVLLKSCRRGDEDHGVR